MAESDERVFAETNVEKPHNDNLEGAKSTKVSGAEAEEERTFASKAPKLDKEPEEVKATAEILPEDAKSKSDRSTEEATQ